VSAAILAVVVDCADACSLARFWAGVLDRIVVERNPREYRVGDPSTDGTVLYFMDVPEPKASKNRLHIDVVTAGALSTEVERLVLLGGTLTEYRTDPTALSNPDQWAVMADPEGHEFCVTSTATLSDWFE
jgi:hypothetical protein